MKQIILLSIISVLPVLVMGQNKGKDSDEAEKQVLAYKRLFSYADSLPIRGRVGQVDDNLLPIIKALDKQRPVAYYEKAAEFMDKGNYNEASFLYYVGNLRYHYYNSSNPNYSLSDDGALLAAFNYALGEPMGYYLRSNADNFIEILKKAVAYHLTNDYEFYSRNKDPDKYSLDADKLNKVIADIEASKEKYQATWNDQRQEFTRDLDNILEEIKKKQ